VSAPDGGIGLGRATLLAVLSVVAFVLILAIAYLVTGARGTVAGIPPTAAPTTAGGS
jgi:hypothetical protein